MQNKIEILNYKFLEARKNKNEIEKALYSTIKGEYETILKNNQKNEDVNMIFDKIIKKFIKNCEIINNDKSCVEIELLKQFLPKELTYDELKQVFYNEILVTDVAKNIINDIFINGNKNKIGALVGLLMKNKNGTSNPKMVNDIVNDYINNYGK